MTGQYPKKKGIGTVAAIVSDPSPRYGDFVQALMGVMNRMHGRAALAWLPGVNVTGNCNEACKAALEHGAEWLWLIGDDHIFEPNILERLLAHDVDVIVPHCLKRIPGFEPVLYGSADGDVHSLAEIPTQGLFEVYASGQAGMLIRSNVLEAIGDPWFETFGKQNEDLMFSRKIREAGFTIQCDPQIMLGHIALTCVWPLYVEGQGWSVDFDLGSQESDQHVVLGRIGNSLTPA